MLVDPNGNVAGTDVPVPPPDGGGTPTGEPPKGGDTPPPGDNPPTGDDPVAYWKSEARKAFQARDEAKAKIEEFEEAERQRATDRARRKEDWQTVEKDYQQRLADKDNRIAELEKTIQDGKRAVTFNGLVNEVHGKVKHVDRFVVEAAIKTIVDGGFELPDEPDGSTVEAVVTRMRAKAPGLFTAPSGGAPNDGAPGTVWDNKPIHELPVAEQVARVEALAKRRGGGG